jgi:hypothetical protein
MTYQLQQFLVEFQNIQCFALEFDSDIVSCNSVSLLSATMCCIPPLISTYRGLINRVAPIGSGVVVPAKTTLQNIVTSASPDVLHSWAVPSSRVSTRNSFGEHCETLFLVLCLLFCFGMIGEPAFAMEPIRPRGYMDLNVGLNRYGEPVVLR